ncbi:MAG: GntR family transcriptional regulator [Bacteroidota bacterium]
MATATTPKSIFINQGSRVPKYRQVVNTVLWEIEQEEYKPGDRLPSINENSAEYDLSRDTVEKAYRELCHRGIITSVPGKGYYLNARPEHATLKVLVILNKLSPFKADIYRAFVQEAGSKVAATIYVHDYNPRSFQGFVLDNLGFYDYYLIMPHFVGSLDIVRKTLAKIPKNKLILLDKDVPDVGGNYGLIAQDYAQDVYKALGEAAEDLQKYERLSLILPERMRNKGDIQHGVSVFCREKQIPLQTYEGTADLEVKKGDVYLVVDETDLSDIIRKSQQAKLKPGRDIGILAYNDTPLKSVLAGGINVVTTDHLLMGQEAARMVLNHSLRRISNPFRYIRRATL